MSNYDLTPDALKQQHTASIASSDTFIPQGVSRQAALDYLKTDEGAMYWWRVAETAAPNVTSSMITDRAVDQIKSGLDLPRMETIDTRCALLKFVPEGSNPTSYSPFWARESAVNAVIAKGGNISDALALPIGSEAPRYGVYRITAQVPTQIFVNTVAPTSELGGLVTKNGGAEQVLVPNRQLYHQAVYVKAVDNTPALVVEAERGLSPNMVRSLGVASAAAVLYDATATAGRVSDLRQQQNETGAQSTILHFEGRNLGALGGAVLGAELFGSAGAETGPFDLFVAAAGAGVGAYYGKKLANEHDQAQIYNQTDPQGISWHYDPKQPEQGWTRDLPPLPQTPQGQHFTADPALAERLGFQANNKATELAMAYAPKPEDPYAQPAGKGDNHSVDDARWMRDVASHTWSRQVVDKRLEHGLVCSHVEPATPARAAQLDQAAEQTIAQNLSHSQRAMAQQYQASYEQRNWKQFGPLPDAISNALEAPDNTLLASDGHTYRRDTEGHWGTPGRVFGTNLADAQMGQELDATMAAKQAQNATAPLPGDVAQGSSATLERSSSESLVAHELSPAFRAASEMLDRVTTAMDSVDRSLLRKETESFVTSNVGRAFFAQAGITVEEEKEKERAHDASARDPREPSHPDHAMTQGIRQKLTALHAEAGIYPSSNRIEPLTAAVALHARENRMTQVDQLQFNADKSSVIAMQDPRGSVVDGRAYSATPVHQALQTPPEQSYQQMNQVTQQQAHMDQAMQQQAVQSQQQNPVMGR